MLRYIAKRSLMLLTGIALILTVAFFAIYRLPGDPARMILGPRASAETVAEFQRAAGLHEPVTLQFARFSKRMITLDFGASLTNRRPVADLLKERAEQTLVLIAYSVAILILFGMCLPLLLRVARLGILDNLFRALWTGTATAPPYVLAIVTLLVLAGWLGVLPAIFDPDQLRCWIAAAFVLAAYPTALVSRLFFTALENSLNSDYAYRARALGFQERTILLREALPNSVGAPVSAAANGLAYFATGTFFVEVAFGVGGIGTLTYEAIRNKDVTVLAAVCLLFAIAISVVSAGLELGQHLLDPRLRRRNGWFA
jgi:peptide/nickel transport system permease protein